MINRTLESKIQNVLNKKKAIIILGAQQVGKTTLLHLLFDKFQNVLWLSGDSPDIISLFKSFSRAYPQAIIKVIHRENFEEFLLS